MKTSKTQPKRISAAVALIKNAMTNNSPGREAAIEEALQAAMQALKPLPKSEEVTRRLNAVLQSYRELAPTLQDKPTGRDTVEAIRAATIEKLGVADTDDALPEETIRKDMQHIGPLLRLVRMGVVPSKGRPRLGKKTEQEMDRIRRKHARIGGRNYSAPPPDERPSSPSCQSEAVLRRVHGKRN